MPKAEGKIRIDELGTNAGETFAGELLGVIFQEVTIAQDYQTTPVADGEEIHFMPWSFETQLGSLD